jgi:hypothetical protein
MAEKNRENLDAREYRDEQGNVHHHTKTYMEQHGEPGSSQASGEAGSRRDEERGRGGDGEDRDGRKTR